MSRAADPLENAALHRGQHGAGLFQTAQGRVMVDPIPGAHRVYGDVNAEILSQEIEGRIQDANMRLNAGQDNLGPRLTVKLLDDGRYGARAERDLVGSHRQTLRQLRDRSAKAARILLLTFNLRFPVRANDPTIQNPT